MYVLLTILENMLLSRLVNILSSDWITSPTLLSLDYHIQSFGDAGIFRSVCGCVA